MNWQSLDNFLHMGGYGLYVWGSYGLTLAVMLVEALAVRHRQRQAFAAARQFAQEQEKDPETYR